MTDFTGLPNLDIGDVIDPYSQCLVIDYEAEAAVTKGDPVYLSSDGKVSPAAAVQDCIGVATKSASVGAKCPVCVRGRVKVKAGAAIGRGKAVYGADATKRVLVMPDINEGGAGTYSWSKKLGISEQSAAAADDLITILVAK